MNQISTRPEVDGPFYESPEGKSVLNSDKKRIHSFIEENIQVPKPILKTKIILCPVGRVGSGKTTVLKAISKELGLVLISTDLIRIILRKNGYNTLRIEELSGEVVTRHLQAGHSVAIDADCVSHREIVEGIGKKFNAQVFWIHVNPPEEYILNKLKNLNKLKHDHPRHLSGPEEGIRDYFRRKVLHKELDFPFIYVFDTSKKETLGKQVEEAMEKIKNQVLISSVPRPD